MNDIEIKKEWLYIERELRYILCQDNELITKDYFQIDDLKSAIIALCGFKLFGDNNEVFYENMKEQFKNNIDYLIERFPNNRSIFTRIQEFVNNHL